MKNILLFLLAVVLSSCINDKLKQEEDTFIEINGNRIHTKIVGKGQAIVLVHGGYLNLDMWDSQMDELTQRNKVIRFSDLGHGKSQNTGSQILGYSIIEKLVAEEVDQKAILVGLSWGAMICVDYTLKHPQNVDKLILVSPGLSGWEYFKDTIAHNNFLLRQKAIENSDTAAAAKLFHKSWVIGLRREAEDRNDLFLSSSLEIIQQTMSEHWQEDWSALDSIKAISRLSEIHVPTYVIIGSEDVNDILLIADEYTKQIPNSKKIIIENAAHLVNMERPEEFNAVLRNILKE